MTGYVSQPIEPFYVPPKVLKPQTRSYMSEPADSANKNVRSSSEHGSEFQKWNSPQVKIVMAVIFALLYVLVQREPAALSVCIVVLLICTLLRLDDYKRKIAQIPLTITALMLASQTAPTRILATAWINDPFQQFQIASLPLFFAVCLFYMPNGQSYTRKLLLSVSVMLLASGLLPRAGAAALFIAVQYLLFVAIVFGLGLDFANHSQAKQQEASQ